MGEIVEGQRAQGGEIVLGPGREQRVDAWGCDGAIDAPGGKGFSLSEFGLLLNVAKAVVKPGFRRVLGFEGDDFGNGEGVVGIHENAEAGKGKLALGGGDKS